MTQPSIYANAYVDDDHNILQVMQENYREGVTLQQQFWTEADIDTRFRAGDQTLWNQIYGNLPLVSRRTFMFNRVRRIVNMIIGRQRQGRKSTIVTPSLPSSQDTADDLSQVLMWVNNNNNAYNTISDAFEGSVVTGINLISTWMDFTDDPISGDIKSENLGFNAFLIDPMFRNQNLSDCNYIWTRKWMTKKQVIQLLPERRAEIEAMNYTANRDDKFIFMPANFQYGIRKLLPFDEYWYLSSRKAHMIVDTLSGDTMEWPGDEENLRDYLRAYPQVKAIITDKPCVHLAVVVNGRVMYHGRNPMGTDRYPFVGMFCYFDPSIPYFPWKMQGVVRGLRDAQFLYNRRKVVELDILESQINSGVKYKEGALLDPNDAFLSGQGRQLVVKTGYQLEDVQPIPPPQVPESMMQLSQYLAGEMSEISGVNEELLGVAEQSDQTGVLAALRQSAGITTLQVIFDQLDQSQKQLGELYLDLIINNFTPGKVEKILGKAPTPEFYHKAFQKYGCSVEEGMLTTSQRQMQFNQLLQLQSLGINVPPSILIETTTLQRKKEFIEALESQAEAQAKQDEIKFQQETQEQEIVAKSLAAKAESDEALAAERLNKIKLDAALSAERLQRADEERMQGTLAVIKAVKELEEIDINQLHKLVQMFKTLQDATQGGPSNEPTNPEQPAA
jgi:hypothetical protein